MITVCQQVKMKCASEQSSPDEEEQVDPERQLESCKKWSLKLHKLRLDINSPSHPHATTCNQSDNSASDSTMEADQSLNVATDTEDVTPVVDDLDTIDAHDDAVEPVITQDDVSGM